MDFTANELRNTKNSLLKRVQRQVDLDNENKEKEYFNLLFEKNLKKNKIFGDIKLDEESEEEPVLFFEEQPKPKKTRLNLFENRKGKR
jgi:hypothetical protein